MADSNLVASLGKHADTTSNPPAEHKENPLPTQQPTHGPPIVSSFGTSGLSLVRRFLQVQGISTTASDIIVSACRPGTINQYRPYLCKWQQYCGEREIDPLRPSIADGINLLADLFHSGAGYSAVKTARCALLSLLTRKFFQLLVLELPPHLLPIKKKFL